MLNKDIIINNRLLKLHFYCWQNTDNSAYTLSQIIGLQNLLHALVSYFLDLVIPPILALFSCSVQKLYQTKSNYTPKKICKI